MARNAAATKTGLTSNSQALPPKKPLRKSALPTVQEKKTSAKSKSKTPAKQKTESKPTKIKTPVGPSLIKEIDIVVERLENTPAKKYLNKNMIKDMLKEVPKSPQRPKIVAEKLLDELSSSSDNEDANQEPKFTFKGKIEPLKSTPSSPKKKININARMTRSARKAATPKPYASKYNP